MQLDLTIVIPVRNEEQNLSKCLTAIGTDLVHQVVVLDSNSTDQTVAISKSFGATVIDFVWDGRFPKKRNWYLRNHTPTTKWVMFLDADEFLTDGFKDELRRALQSSDNYVAYWLRYSIYFLGKLNKGGYFLRKLALFQVGKGEYEKIDEDQWSNFDMEIHEHPIIEGRIGTIRSKIDHQDMRGVSYYVTKHNEYSSWEAARFLKLASDQNKIEGWSWMQKLKYRLMRTPFLGPAYFIGSFVFMGGFRDGTRGFAFATLKMSYFMQTYLKIRELEEKQQQINRKTLLDAESIY
ncbi:glycosyltransferase family 2 protein [Larkinella ripae]